MFGDSDTLEVHNPIRHSMGVPEVEIKHVNQLPIVFVIDDDIDNLEIVCWVLEKFSCLPLCETNGQTALETIGRCRPDLVVLDIRLPGLNGLEIIRTLKSCEVTRTIPVIVVTALASLRDREEALCSGCDHYLSKPYLLEELEQLMFLYLPCSC